MAGSKVRMLMARAEKAYAAENRGWFTALPTADLAALWGVACVTEAPWDDEVYDALAARGWFES
jgi:hypothetical protein